MSFFAMTIFLKIMLVSECLKDNHVVDFDLLLTLETSLLKLCDYWIYRFYFITFDRSLSHGSKNKNNEVPFRHSLYESLEEK